MSDTYRIRSENDEGSRIKGQRDDIGEVGEEQGRDIGCADDIR